MRAERRGVCACAHEPEARELVCGVKRKDVVGEVHESRVLAPEAILVVVERDVERVRGLVGYVNLSPPLVRGAGVERRALAELNRGGTDTREARVGRVEVEVELPVAEETEDEEMLLLRRRRACVEIVAPVRRGALVVAAEERAGRKLRLHRGVERRIVREAETRRDGEAAQLRVLRVQEREAVARGAELRLEYALVAFVEADADEGLFMKVKLELRLVVVELAAPLPVEVSAEVVVDVP